MSADQLTYRQMEVLSFINAYRATQQCNPTCAEISAHFGWASANAADDHLTALQRKLVLTRRHGKSRGYIVATAYTTLRLTTA